VTAEPPQRLNCFLLFCSNSRASINQEREIRTRTNPHQHSRNRKPQHRMHPIRRTPPTAPAQTAAPHRRMRQHNSSTKAPNPQYKNRSRSITRGPSPTHPTAPAPSPAKPKQFPHQRPCFQLSLQKQRRVKNRGCANTPQDQCQKTTQPPHSNEPQYARVAILFSFYPSLFSPTPFL